MKDYITINEKEMEKLKNITILQFAQELEHVLNNDIINENTNVLDFLNIYLENIKEVNL